MLEVSWKADVAPHMPSDCPDLAGGEAGKVHALGVHSTTKSIQAEMKQSHL